MSEMFFEYTLARPALMPDMSGKPQWTILSGGYDRLEVALAMREKRPYVKGEKPVILVREVTEWREYEGE